MTDKRDISRRNALKGIAGAGALVGGVGLGFAGSASADRPSQHPREQIDDVSFDGCGSVEIVFRKGTIFPVEGLQFRFYSEKIDSVATTTPTIRWDETEPVDDKHGSKRRRFTFAGGIYPKTDRVLSVSAGKKRYENPHHCKKYGKIDVEGVCYKDEKNRAQFRVDNHTKKDVKVSWMVVDGEQSGKLTLGKKGSETIWVDLEHGEKTKVAIYYDDEKVAVAKANTDDHCGKDDDGDDGDDD